MFRRILVPVDGSAASTLGLRHAIGLARDQRARLRVLNVLDDMIVAPRADDYPAADMTVLIKSMKDTGRKALEQAAALASSAGLKAETLMVESRSRYVSDVILDHARAWRADVVVMGTHGRRGLKRLLLGSDAERVLREAPVPVLLVRTRPTTRSAPRKSTSKRR